MDKKVLRGARDHQGTGRNYNRQAYTLGQKIIRMFLTKIVEKMLEGDRILLPYGKTMYIGVIPHNPHRIAKWRKKKQLNLHTQGKRYGIKLLGIKEKVYFRMPFRYRKELAMRIREGQSYLN